MFENDTSVIYRRRMGEVYAGPGFRTCSRSGCAWPAVATLSFDYDAQRAWLDDLAPDPEVSGYDLCDLHVQRFSPPVGWRATDRRRSSPSSPQPDNEPRSVTAETPEPTEVADDSMPGQAALPEV